MSSEMVKKLPIGPCNTYWNDVRLGSPKTQVALRTNIENVMVTLEDRNVEVNSHKTKDIAEIDIVIADFTPDQIRYAWAQAMSKLSGTTIQDVGYNSSVMYVHRYNEYQHLTGTVTVTVDGAGYESGTIKVFKGDLSNAPDGYTQGTDYTSTSSTGIIKRIDAGSIGDPEDVIVEYNQSATSAVAYFGGKLADFEGELRISHKMDDGKYLTITASRAKRIGASDIAVAMAAEFAGIPMTFKVLADLTKAPGKQLVDVGVET